MADAIGLAALALLTVAMRLVVGTQDVSNLIWCFIYFFLAMVALFDWHAKSLGAKRDSIWPETSIEYLRYALISVGAGAVSFVVDIVVGSINHPDLSTFGAATNAGGPFGFFVTILICPALTFVLLSGAVRQFFLERTK